VHKSEHIFLAAAPAETPRLSGVIAAKPLPVQVALKYAASIAGILARAHKAGSIHGSLCPAAIALSPGGAGVLGPSAVSAADFERYRSPEQVRGRAADERSDIFCFGALLFHMIAGCAPFPGESETLAEAILEKPPAWDSAGERLPPAIRRVLEDCLEKSPDRRRQRMQNVAAELRFITIQLRSPIQVRRPTPRNAIYVPRDEANPVRPRRFSPVWVIAALSVVALAAVAVGAALWLVFR
jgi:serine/threonine protein kinase